MEIRTAVAQEDPLGCAIACFAFVNQISYKKAKGSYFDGGKNAIASGYLCRDLVRALAAGGKEYDYKYIKRKMDFKEDTIVFVKRSRRYPKGHYLVKSASGWMDPYMNFNVGKMEKARAGFRIRLPGKPIYAVFPINKIGQ